MQQLMSRGGGAVRGRGVPCRWVGTRETDAPVTHLPMLLLILVAASTWVADGRSTSLKELLTLWCVAPSSPFRFSAISVGLYTKLCGGPYNSTLVTFIREPPSFDQLL